MLAKNDALHRSGVDGSRRNSSGAGKDGGDEEEKGTSSNEAGVLE